MRITSSLAVLAMLGACSKPPPPTMTVQVGNATLLERQRVGFDNTFSDLPFDTGPVYVVTNEGYLRTFSLAPCGVQRVCGSDGRAGLVQRTPSHFIVTGAYRDRTFFLSPGGGGYLTFRGENRDLAWN